MIQSRVPQDVTDQRQIYELSERFIQLANNLGKEGYDRETINAALMYSSAVFVTYLTAGNQGFLKEGGVSKVTAVFRRNLMTLQRLKQQQAKQSGLLKDQPTA